MNENKKEIKQFSIIKKLKNIECPKFAWILMIGLGFYDLIRGFMHTFLNEFAAINIFGIDLSGGVENQMFLLGIFGITNYITGIMLILIGISARHLVPIILPILPVAYFGGSLLIPNPTGGTAGAPGMLIYFILCITAFLVILAIKIKKKIESK
ncbi:MAG: hypothetical protein EU549_04165 [Promethearchaeota archaeon]|nr:MAG: hypothetical protein EU549_04165 [Candidatus Lokiarchaeota archaeon]